MVAVQIAFDFARSAAPTSPRVEPVALGELEPTAAHERAASRQLHARELSPGSQELAQSLRRERAAALELALRARVAVPLRLTITDNRRTMLSLHRRAQFVEIRLHHMFLQADQSTRDALGDYLFDGGRDAAQSIARFIEQHRAEIRRELRRPLAISTAGAHHDLAEIYRDVNVRYFEGGVQAHITWGRDPAPRKRRARRSIKLGSYTSRDRLIRVHPALDAAYVPRFFVEYIVYHEMLHQVLPPKVQRGRRDLHGPAFKAREREFHAFDAALRWERDNLDRLLRADRKARPQAGR